MGLGTIALGQLLAESGFAAAPAEMPVHRKRVVGANTSTAMSRAASTHQCQNSTCSGISLTLLLGESLARNFGDPADRSDHAGGLER